MSRFEATGVVRPRHLKSDVDIDFMLKEAAAAAQQVHPEAMVFLNRTGRGGYTLSVIIRAEMVSQVPLAAILSDPDLISKLARQNAKDAWANLIGAGYARI